MATQWRTGFAGPTGLDYTALHSMLRLRRIKRARWNEIVDDVQIMEDAALKQMAENRPKTSQ